MKPTHKTHLPSLLILLALGGGAAFLLLLALISAFSSVFNLMQGTSAPATEMINAAVFLFEALLIGLCAWFVLHKTLGWESAERSIRFPFEGFYVPVVLLLVAAALLVGGLTAWQEVAFLSWAVLPLLTIFAVALPVWLLLGVGGREIDLGARWRFFGALGLGMTVGPFLMIALEIVALFAVSLVFLVYIALQPGLAEELFNLAEVISSQTDPETLIRIFAPYLFQPGAIFGGLLYAAAIVSLIEELLKPLAVWLFAKSLETPAQGFALGLLSGAAFALLESLNAAADGSSAWGAIVAMRAATTLLHIAASGLVGWGIASMFKEKNVLRFLSALTCAALLHGLWNACALAVALVSIGYMVNSPLPWLPRLILPALGGMLTLGIGMLLFLITANRRLRSETSR